MSIRFPIDPQGASSLSPESFPTSKKRKREERKTEEVAQKSLSKEKYQLEKKIKSEAKRIVSSKSEVMEVIHAVGERVVHSRKRKAEPELGMRKRQKMLSPDEALILDLSSKKLSNDPEIILSCLHTLSDKNLFDAKDQTGTPLLKSFLSSSFQKFHKKQYYRLHDLLMQAYPRIREDELKKMILDIIIRFTTPTRCQDLIKNLHFIKQFSINNLEPTINSLFRDIGLSLEQKQKIFSFMDTNKVSINETSWAIALRVFHHSEAFIDTIKTIPNKERAAFFRDNPVLLSTKTDPNDKGPLIKILYKTPPKERNTLIEALHEIPSTERTQLIQDAASLFDTTMGIYHRTQLLKILYKIPHAERVPFFQNIRLLFTSQMNWDTKFELIEEILKIPISERSALIRDMALFCNNTLSEHAIINVLKELYKIPQSERTILIQDTMPLFTEDMEWRTKIVCLNGMLKFPHSARASLIRDTTPLLKDDMSWGEKEELLETIHKIPQSERTQLIQDTLPFFTDDMGTYEKTRLLEVIHQIPQAERTSLFQEIRPLLKNVIDGRHIAGLLFTIHTIPQVERVGAIVDTMPLIRDSTTAQGKAFLVKALSKIPRKDRAEVIQDTSPLFTNTMTGVEQAGFLATIHSLSKEKRSAFIQQVMPLLPTLLQVAPEDSLVIFYLLPDPLKSQERLLATQHLLKNAEYKASIMTALERDLVDEKTTPLMLQRLADFITRCSTELDIHEEHPLMQKAIEILAASEVEEKKNPFSLYRKLQTLAKEPASIQLDKIEVAGTKTALNLEKLQESAKAFTISREELPQDATEEAWQELVHELQRKVESNPNAKQKLEDDYGTKWTQLWNGCFSDSYLSGLLKLSTGKVSIVEAQFKAIIHYLLTKERGVKPGELFSEQDDLLIKQAMSIQLCTGGKKEGIALTYKLLDSAYKYHAKGLEGKTAEDIRVNEFLAELVQKTIIDQFSGTNALMQELVGIKNIEQAPHQAIYLKNLIGSFVGLTHEVSFDQYTGVLYDSLIEKPREEVLKIFFRHMTPQVLVDELKRVVNSDFKKYINILAYSSLWNEEMEDGTDMDEDMFTPIRLNELGALRILQKAGYLTSA